MKRIGYFLFITGLFACQRELHFPVNAHVPAITTDTAAHITSATAISGGNISNDGGFTITARGICYDTVINPAIAGSKTFDGTGAGSFESLLSGLTPHTIYYIRAYATNSAGTGYGAQLSFKTEESPVNPVILTTSAPSDITAGTVTTGGDITSSGGTPVTGRGVCYDTVANPTVASDKVTSGSGIGLFSVSITGLQANTVYYVRAYAINAAGTFYGNQLNFSTVNGSIATVITTPIFTITTHGGLSGGDIIAANGSAITEKGICYSKNFNPVIAINKITGGSGLGSFTCEMAGLEPGTTYYVRAYALNSAGTAYGNQVSFTTKN